MDSITRKVPLAKITPDSREKTEDSVASEITLGIVLNGSQIISLPCSPQNLDHLAAGYLLAEGYIGSISDIKSIKTDEQAAVVKVDTVNSAKPVLNDSAIKVESDLRITADEVFALMEKFIGSSEVFAATGGVHSAALCDRQNILVYKEDIGRNNAVDKIFGECLLNGSSLDDRVIVTSCRISSEILLKIARRKIPVIITKSPPTDLGVKLAGEYGITLLGFVRGKKMNAYTHDWRIAINDNK